MQNLLVSRYNIAGIEIMQMICKGHMRAAGKLRAAQEFYSLAG
jgi:hypothetical protein